MDAERYAVELLTILRNHSKQALETFTAADEKLPDKATGVSVGIHPGQDGEGQFDIWIHLEGPDLYVLNKAIAPHRILFEVERGTGGFIPDVPMFDPFDTDFDVNDVIVDTSLQWLQEIWPAFDGRMKTLPVTVFGEDGYGTKTPKRLR
ncbi:MAG: DUF6389 family protein [Pseudomonadota bacterium]